MEYRKASEKDLKVWSILANKLWPHDSVADLKEILSDSLITEKETGILAVDGDEVIGFINISIREDYVNGSSSTPVGYIEGIYVEEDYRYKGIARALIAEGEKWALSMGCVEMGSDVLIENEDSINFHANCGYEEVERVACFIKTIGDLDG